MPPLRRVAMHPQEALRFPARCAQLCEKHCKALRDFTGEGGETLALDVGCAVGGAAFELARVFDNVLGIDYSQAFVDAAKVWVILGQCPCPLLYYITIRFQTFRGFTPSHTCFVCDLHFLFSGDAGIGEPRIHSGG